MQACVPVTQPDGALTIAPVEGLGLLAHLFEIAEIGVLLGIVL